MWDAWYGEGFYQVERRRKFNRCWFWGRPEECIRRSDGRPSELWRSRPLMQFRSLNGRDSGHLHHRRDPARALAVQVQINGPITEEAKRYISRGHVRVWHKFNNTGRGRRPLRGGSDRDNLNAADYEHEACEDSHEWRCPRDLEGVLSYCRPSNHRVCAQYGIVRHQRYQRQSWSYFTCVNWPSGGWWWPCLLHQEAVPDLRSLLLPGCNLKSATSVSRQSSLRYCRGSGCN